MMKNRLIVAVAGSGKTTELVKEALSIKDKRVLITTFTRNNADEIRNKLLDINGLQPFNMTIQTWFSFLLQHGVRPYQTSMHQDLEGMKIGFCLHEGKSGVRLRDSRGKLYYFGESDFFRYYFQRSKKLNIYNDKISQFIYECNKRTNGSVVDRISRVFSHIFVDEVQDLAGWDLEIIKLLLKTSSSVLMVGDPRQGTYTTNDSQKNKKYRNAGIVEFFRDKCRAEKVIIDDERLIYSHRNCDDICKFSSLLYPRLKESRPCECRECRNNAIEHQGVFLIRNEHVPQYIARYRPQVLRYSNSLAPDKNFGQSKGLGFSRVLIYPTRKMEAFLCSGDLKFDDSVLAKFYVAVTRASSSVGFVTDYDDREYLEPLKKYIP